MYFVAMPVRWWVGQLQLILIQFSRQTVQFSVCGEVSRAGLTERSRASEGLYQVWILTHRHTTPPTPLKSYEISRE